MIPLLKPIMAGNEIKYVTEAIRDGWVSSAGSYVTKFEQDIINYVKTGDAAAVQSGTAAIHTALILAGVRPGDEVIVPTLTFIAAVNPVKYCCAEPVFMDCDEYLNMDIEKVASFLHDECEKTSKGLKNKKSGRTIRALIVVHVFGNMANMIELKELTNAYGIALIEDATEALGTYYTKGELKNSYAGTIGDFGAFSFNGNKIITTGGGGMLVSKDSQKIKDARYLSSQAKDDPICYTHNQIGYNYRMTNLQAALGVAQLEKIEYFIKNKINNFNLYYEDLEEISNEVILVKGDPKARNNYWLYGLLIKNRKWDPMEWIMKLKDFGIESRPLWNLIHTQSIYKQNQSYYIEKANYYLNRVFNIPSSADLKEEEIHYICVKLKEIINQ